MILQYNNLKRQESDETIIANLVRKGWIILPEEKEPEVPVFDSGLEKVIFNRQTKTYEIVNLSAEEKYQLQINKGYVVEPENFILGLQENDRVAFTQMVTLIQEGLALGVLSNSNIIAIKDITSQTHELTVLRFRQIMVAYGFFFKVLWDKLA